LDETTVCPFVACLLQSVRSQPATIKTMQDGIYLTPKIATLKNRATPYRGEWIIYQYANREYRAIHEVPQLNGERKAGDSVSLSTLSDAQTFSSYLSSHGWQKVGDH
jgi:hypothetical protein